MNSRIQHLIGIGGCAAAALCFILGLMFLSLGMWGLFIADSLLFFVAIGVVAWEVLSSLSQVRQALNRYMHRWGE